MFAAAILCIKFTELVEVEIGRERGPEDNKLGNAVEALEEEHLEHHQSRHPREVHYHPESDLFVHIY